MKSFREFLDICERYHPLPRGRMDRRATRTAAVGAGHLGIAAAVTGAESAIGEVGDLPDEIAKGFVERSVKPLGRASKIIKARMTHSPEASQEKERQNRERGRNR